MEANPLEEKLFDTLSNANSILGLIGQPEDAHLECKGWPDQDAEAQKTLAKAACGLTNAEGGVLIIGMKATSSRKDEPDVIESAAPVKDTSAVKSRVLNLLGNLVEPGIVGIAIREVAESEGSKSGFVVVHVPASYGAPRRSRKDWKFYQRIGAGTFPMEYFQIEERFGTRPPPKLELFLEEDGFRPGFSFSISRWFVLGLRNSGAGCAKFPSIRYRRDCGLIVYSYGLDGNGGVGLPQRASDSSWYAFRGGVDDLIYPGELLKITKLRQDGTPHVQQPTIPFSPAGNASLLFRALDFYSEISCEGIPTLTVEMRVEEALYPPMHH